MLIVLSIVWIPSVIGLTYLWATYWPLRHLPGIWLLQMLCVTATPITVVMLYVSVATYERLIGSPFTPDVQAVAGVVLVLLLAWVVPYKALRIYLTTHGRTSEPKIPVTNGKGT